MGDVLEEAIRALAIEALVRRGAFQGAEVSDVRTDLDVIKLFLPDAGRYTQPPAIPRDMVLRMVLVDVLCQQLHACGVVVAAHPRYPAPLARTPPLLPTNSFATHADIPP